MEAKIVYKSFASNPDYFVLSGKGVFRVVQEDTQSDYEIGEFVELEGKEKGGAIYAESIEMAAEENEKTLDKKATAWKASLVEVSEPGNFVDSPTLKAMAPVFKEASMFLQEKIIEMTPFWVRFDEDADGITSALYLKGFVEHFVRTKKIPYPESLFQAFQAEAPIFEEKHFKNLHENVDNYAKKPLIVLLDHGGNEESISALSDAKKEGYELFLVDHHPPNMEAISKFDFTVQPFLHGGDSTLPTGLLTYELASTIMPAEKKYAKFAMQGDKSPYAKETNYKEPVVIDYISTEKPSLKQYESMLHDQEKIDFLYAKSMAARRKAAEEAKKRAVTDEINGLKLTWLDLSFHTAKYPPKGGVTQGLHEALGEGEANVTIGFDKERLIFRVTGKAEALGFKANELIDSLKKVMPIASGGGHPRAASVRLKPKTLEKAREEIEGYVKRLRW
ncbi:hypothetical protein HZC09_04695 [Candidatus Micrarchaeota archaeon]|nr:hypothetical protein [Candidatus Micrarchaeota archaeon]